MINSLKSKALLERFNILFEKASFDLSSLKKGRLPGHAHSLWRLCFSLLCLMLSRDFNME